MLKLKHLISPDGILAWIFTLPYLTPALSLSTEEATSPESGVKERNVGERGEREGESRSASPASRASHASHASPVPDERDDIEHSIPATLIQDPNVER